MQFTSKSVRKADEKALHGSIAAGERWYVVEKGLWTPVSLGSHQIWLATIKSTKEELHEIRNK